MKLLTKSVVLSFFAALMGPALLIGQMASVAQVVHEDPDGALAVRGGASIGLAAGDVLQEGDTLKTNSATLVITLCDGALITLYPESEVTVTSLGAKVAQLKLSRGELLGDTVSGCSIAVMSAAGSARIDNGVYGVLMNESAEGWTLQVRNLDGSVTFTGGSNLDASNVTASIVEAGKTLEVPAGEEIIVRGVYDPESQMFALTQGGAVMSLLQEETISEMREEAERGRAVGRPDGIPGRDVIDDLDTPARDRSAPQVIELPWEDVETASDPG